MKKKLINNSFSLILVPSLEKIEIVHYNEILYLKSDGSYTEFFLEDRKITSSKNIGVYEKKLSINFFRIHHSYIVNLEKIKYICKVNGVSCYLDNNKTIPVSRRKKKDLINFINKIY
jgi:two-component system LytT family response regulator|tara:strand:- start:5 stop:355 length:351 start_codon:yes stop_codon:yes gene_type:complete